MRVNRVGIPSLGDLVWGDGKGSTEIDGQLYQNHDLRWVERNANRKAKSYFGISDNVWDYNSYPLDYPKDN